jgi:hypothetical protein
MNWAPSPVRALQCEHVTKNPGYVQGIIGLRGAAGGNVYLHELGASSSPMWWPMIPMLNWHVCVEAVDTLRVSVDERC